MKIRAWLSISLLQAFIDTTLFWNEFNRAAVKPFFVPREDLWDWDKDNKYYKLLMEDY